MTNLEASKNLIGTNYPFEDATFVTGLLREGVNPDEAFTPGKTFDLALASMIIFLITAADVKEGGYSVTLDRNAMLQTRAGLLNKWDSSKGGTYIRDRSQLW